MAVNEHHRHGAGTHLKMGIITASDTRDAVSDESGRLIRELLEGAGHRMASYEVIPDTPEQIAEAVRKGLRDLDGVIINGGTGISARDSTIEAIRPLIDKELEGFGELFRALSYEEIGSAAFLSRALAGISGGKILVALPGSPSACRLAMEKLLLPELGHMAHLLGLASGGHRQ
ncbi:MAG TPA: molybdenum cofactor biosynthesis protein B [Candidatus Binataceae bacterium]|jgi:molybdenum cofactor biosynthesis protein B|nr:molybdenum cofactor biosynthesis protein B [Candidatus Binataceae bacterium]